MTLRARRAGRAGHLRRQPAALVQPAGRLVQLSVPVRAAPALLLLHRVRPGARAAAPAAAAGGGGRGSVAAGPARARAARRPPAAPEGARARARPATRPAVHAGALHNAPRGRGALLCAPAAAPTPRARPQVRISRRRVLESAAKVFEMYGTGRAVLEIEYFGEVGTGLGPTLEFYTLLSHELQRRGLGLWRCDDGSSAASGGAARAGPRASAFDCIFLSFQSHQPCPSKTNTLAPCLLKASEYSMSDRTRARPRRQGRPRRARAAAPPPRPRRRRRRPSARRPRSRRRRPPARARGRTRTCTRRRASSRRRCRRPSAPPVRRPRPQYFACAAPCRAARGAR